MKKLLMVAGLVLALGACKDDFDKAMGEAEDLTNKLCACKDTACADKVREERKEMKKKLKATFDKDKKPSEDQMKRADAVDKKWRTCADKLEAPPPS